MERTIYQYHYTNWPDHGVPDHPLPILSFVRRSAAANGDGAGPILVHCRSVARRCRHSAGWKGIAAADGLGQRNFHSSTAGG